MAAHPLRSLSRRVSFNESSLRPISPPRSVAVSMVGYGDLEPQGKDPQKPSTRFNICCAWTSLAVGVFTAIVLIAGGISYAYFQSNLPEFRVQYLNVGNFSLVKAPTLDTLLNVDIVVVLTSQNMAEKMPVYYSSLTADLEVEDIPLGDADLPEVTIQPGNITSLTVQTSVRNLTVTESDGRDFKNRVSAHQLLIDVLVGGNIHFGIGGRKMSGFPFKVICHPYQGDVDDGDLPKCQVKMTPVS